MSTDSFLLMRHEIILTVILLLVLVAEIFSKNKMIVFYVATGLFLVHTVIGFIPQQEGFLFGRMYHTNELLHFVKNVLNAGVLIILLQSSGYIKEKLVPGHKS